MLRNREVVVFGLALWAGWLVAAQLGLGPETAGAQTGAASGGPTPAQALAMIDHAERSMSRGDLDLAARTLRGAWRTSEAREPAAEALKRLQNAPGFSIEADESQIRETMALLDSTFTRTETKHFVILSNTSSAWTRSRAALLERTYHQFFRVMDRMEYPATPPEHKLLCVLFATHDAYRAFAIAHDNVEASWIAGYYAGYSNRVVFYDDQTSPSYQRAFARLDEQEEKARDTRAAARRERNPEKAKAMLTHSQEVVRRVEEERKRLKNDAALSSGAKTIHEAVHLLAFNCGVQSRGHQYPFWITEGLAVAFETDRPSRAFGPDHKTHDRAEEFQEQLEEGRLLSLESLVGRLGVAGHSALLADTMYCQSYALFEHLYRYERAALTRYLLSMMDETPGKTTEARQAALFEEAFGPIGSLERRWLKRAGSQ